MTHPTSEHARRVRLRRSKTTLRVRAEYIAAVERGRNDMRHGGACMCVRCQVKRIPDRWNLED